MALPIVGTNRRQLHGASAEVVATWMSFGARNGPCRHHLSSAHTVQSGDVTGRPRSLSWSWAVVTS